MYVGEDFSFEAVEKNFSKLVIMILLQTRKGAGNSGSIFMLF